MAKMTWHFDVHRHMQPSLSLSVSHQASRRFRVFGLDAFHHRRRHRCPPGTAVFRCHRCRSLCVLRAQVLSGRRLKSCSSSGMPPLRAAAGATPTARPGLLSSVARPPASPLPPSLARSFAHGPSSSLLARRCSRRCSLVATRSSLRGSGWLLNGRKSPVRPLARVRNAAGPRLLARYEIVHASCEFAHV